MILDKIKTRGENLSPLEGHDRLQYIIDEAKNVEPLEDKFKIDENKTKLLGLVAQEAEAVCPSLVKSQPDLGADNEDLGTKTKVLKYSILYMKAVKALQEAIARIETLETKVAALEAA